MHQDFESISDLDLGGVSGGMQWESFPRSSNIEDARGMNPSQAAQAFPPGGGGGGGGGGAQPGGGSLGNQLGIDRIGQSPVNAGGGGGGGW